MVTRTMWSGADEVGEYNAAGTLIRRFIPDGSGGMDARLMTVEANGTAYWHHTDRQGSVVATSNAAGQVVATATYSPHGEFGTGVTAPPTGSPFGYTGRQYDPETGLYQYRARYYSPRLGVFLSTDPIGTKDDPNLYLYVGADPVNHTDPTGMMSCPPACTRVTLETYPLRGPVGLARNHSFVRITDLTTSESVIFRGGPNAATGYPGNSSDASAGRGFAEPNARGEVAVLRHEVLPSESSTDTLEMSSRGIRPEILQSADVSTSFSSAENQAIAMANSLDGSNVTYRPGVVDSNFSAGVAYQILSNEDLEPDWRHPAFKSVPKN